MHEVKQHPAWQKYIRQMQGIRDLKQAEAQAKAKAEKAEAEREIGLDLQKALMHFGIYIETPPFVNDVEVDGYHFRLFQGKYFACEDKDSEREIFQFTLVVAKNIPGRTSDDDDPQHYNQIAVNTRHLPKGTSWDYYLCQLADAFDELDSRVAFDVARDAERKQRDEQQAAKPPAVESADDKLLKLLRAIIREEVQRELEY